MLISLITKEIAGVSKLQVEFSCLVQTKTLVYGGRIYLVSPFRQLVVFRCQRPRHFRRPVGARYSLTRDFGVNR